MSDMTLVEWGRKAAGRTRLDAAVQARSPILRFVVGHPGAFAGGRLAGLIGLAALGLAVVAVTLATATVPVAPMPATVTPAAAAAPVWIDIVKPIELFSLEAPDLAQAEKSYAARRHRIGGGRLDVLALGMLGGGAPALRLSLYRRGQEGYARAPVFADIARLAAEAGLSVTRIGLPDLMPTRFGGFEIADIGLRRVTDAPKHADGAAPVSCGGFRLVLDAPALTVTGLACGGQKLVMDKARLGCLIDRLDLASGGDDRPMVNFFAASELKRNNACSGTRLAPDLPHASWLDDRPATPRRNVRRH